MTDQVRLHFQKRRRKLLEILSDLIAARTVNPPGNEEEGSAVVERFCKKHGIEYRLLEEKKGRTNLMANVGRGSPRLLVVCHLDVVPPGEGWKTDPFKATIKGGKVYGRGAADNKGQLAAALLVLAYLKSREKELSGKFTLICTADEEAGSRLGLLALVKKGKVKGDFAIVPDSANRMRGIDVSEKGALFIKITSFGKQAHGSTPEKGRSAIWPMIDLLGILRNFSFPPGAHALHSPPTLNLGTISGGSATNVVPARCEAQIDIRFLPGQKVQAYIEEVKKAIRKVRKENQAARFRLEVMSLHEPTEMDARDPLVEAIRRRAREVLHFTPKPFGMSGSTNVKQLALAGIKAVGFAPGEETAPHSANEFIEVEELLDFATVLALVSLDLLR